MKFLGVIFLIFLSAVLFCEERSVESLIQQLSDDDYRLRDEADYLLRKGGERYYSALEKVADSKEVEVRLRVRSILHHLNAERIWQSANPEKGVQNKWESKQGAFTLKIDPSYTKAEVQEGAHSDGSTYREGNLKFQGTIHSEEQVKIIAFRPGPTKVRAWEKETGNLGTRIPSHNLVSSHPVNQASFTAEIRGISLPKKSVDELTMSFELVAVGGFETLRMKDLRKGNEVSQDSAWIMLDGIEKVEGEYRLSVDAGTEMLFQELRSFVRDSITVYDQFGKRMPAKPVEYKYASNYSGEDLDWDEEDGASDEASAIPVDPYRKITIVPESADQVPSEIAIRYPKYASKRELEFVFKNLGLP